MTLLEISNVCPEAPPGVDTYTDLLISWLKYGVMACIIAAGFLSVGAMAVGKFGSMARVASAGATGLFWSILGAVVFVTIYGVLTAITGRGC